MLPRSACDFSFCGVGTGAPRSRGLRQQRSVGETLLRASVAQPASAVSSPLGRSHPVGSHPASSHPASSRPEEPPREQPPREQACPA